MRRALAQHLVVEGQQHQRIVDHHARERDDPKEAQKRQVQAHDKMPPNRANDAEGNRAHHDEGLAVRSEWHGQQHVDGGKRDGEVEEQAL